MVVDDLGDDEVQELLRERRVKMRLFSQSSQPGDLNLFALGVGRRHPGFCFELTHLLGELKSLGQKVHERGIDVVDTSAQAGQLIGGVLAHAHNLPCVQRAKLGT